MQAQEAYMLDHGLDGAGRAHDDQDLAEETLLGFEAQQRAEDFEFIPRQGLGQPNVLLGSHSTMVMPAYSADRF